MALQRNIGFLVKEMRFQSQKPTGFAVPFHFEDILGMFSDLSRV